MQTIDQIRLSNNHDSVDKTKSIVIHFDYDKKDIEKEIDKYSEKYNLKHCDKISDIRCDGSINEISEKDIEKIEKDVVELAEVFTTVQNMVVQQKDAINTIDINIDNTSEYVIIAQDDLDEIEKIKKANITKKTIIYSVGVLAISIPISILGGPISGISFAILGISSVKGYSIFKGKIF
jgi:hypothetical protein